MYIDANDVKQYMDLNIHQQVADFINKSVAESQKMYLEDLESRLQELLEQEVTGDTVSDVGVGIDLAIKEVRELLEQFEAERKQMNRLFVEKLIQLMQENPSLKVMCKVDSDIVADDGNAWWLGKINDKYAPEIDEYSVVIGEKVIFKSDDDYQGWFEDIYDVDDYKDIPDDEWDDFIRKKVDENAKWEKAIFISITTE